MFSESNAHYNDMLRTLDFIASPLLAKRMDSYAFLTPNFAILPTRPFLRLSQGVMFAT